jgi:capsule polysaccharide export protein KpsE/RkpR
MNYFLHDSKDLSKEYVKKSENFLKEISDKQKRNTLKYPEDFEVINHELRVKQ